MGTIINAIAILVGGSWIIVSQGCTEDRPDDVVLGLFLVIGLNMATNK